MLEIEPLPPDVVKLLKMLGARPLLRAHLALVHDFTVRLTERVSDLWPMLSYDSAAVRMGAATHDIGKTVFPEELTVPGHYHKTVGAGVLLDAGFPQRLTRFARTHGQWRQDEDLAVEDLLVALADTLCKGQRDEELEERCCRVIARECELDPWRVSLRFYEMTGSLAEGAEARLAWQARHGME